MSEAVRSRYSAVVFIFVELKAEGHPAEYILSDVTVFEVCTGKFVAGKMDALDQL